MSASKTNLFCTPNPLIPIALLSLVVFVFMAFQSTQIFQARANLRGILSQQDKPLENTQRMKAQLTALAQGTLKLAENGDKNAQSIIERLKKLGITVAPPHEPSAPPEHIATPSKP